MRIINAFMILIIVSSLLGHQALAAPASPQLVDYQLPDGTTITIQLMGDEKIKWAETPDGYSVLLNEDGFYEYAILNNNGDMVLSGVKANNADERNSEESTFLSGLDKNLQYSESQIDAMLKKWDDLSTPNTQDGEQLLPQETVAAPAYPQLVDYQLPDGTTITIQLMGDEKIKWAETPDGYSVLLNDEGFYEYAILNNKGDMVLSGVKANNADERNSEENTFLSGLDKNLQFSESQIDTMLKKWDDISTPNTQNGKQFWILTFIKQIYDMLIKLFCS